MRIDVGLKVGGHPNSVIVRRSVNGEARRGAAGRTKWAIQTAVSRIKVRVRRETGKEGRKLRRGWWLCTVEVESLKARRG